jgi:hypothetical protein
VSFLRLFTIRYYHISSVTHDTPSAIFIPKVVLISKFPENEILWLVWVAATTLFCVSGILLFLLLRGGITQCVPSTATITDVLCVPNLSSNHS